MLGRVRCAAIPAIRSRVALSIRAAGCATEASLHGQRSRDAVRAESVGAGSIQPPRTVRHSHVLSLGLVRCLIHGAFAR